MNLQHAHVLIARTDNIGDVVLTLPLAGYLKQHFPGIRISFLCREYAAPMVRCCKALDTVIAIEQVKNMSAELRRLNIDTIIFAKPDKALAKAARMANIRHRVGTSHRWFHWLYCNRLAHFSRVNSELHEAQLNFKLLAPLGIRHIPALDEIPGLYQLAAPQYLGTPALQDDCFNLIFHPKSNGNGREWPLTHFTVLAGLLEKHPRIRIWITGSAREGEWIAQHAPALLRTSNVQSVCGKFALDELTAFIAAADGLIASGTGPLHLSAALGQRTLGLFPPIKPIDPARWGALGVRAEVLCRPTGCGKCDDSVQCACMTNITPEEVAGVVLQWEAAAFARKATA
jgi:ADP-heptose:LPS heptosyltransferase